MVDSSYSVYNSDFLVDVFLDKDALQGHTRVQHACCQLPFHTNRLLSPSSLGLFNNLITTNVISVGDLSSHSLLLLFATTLAPIVIMSASIKAINKSHCLQPRAHSGKLRLVSFTECCANFIKSLLAVCRREGTASQSGKTGEKALFWTNVLIPFSFFFPL